MVKSGEWLFRGLSLLLAASLLIGCGGKEERKAKYLERGKEYFEAQNFDKARVEFKNVLQIDPKTADAYYYLGEIEEQEQEWRRAFGSYRKASELDPELIAARKKLAQFYLARAAALRAQDDMSGLANALALAQEEVKAVLQRVPDDLEGLTLEAQLWVLEGKTDEAVAQLQRVLAKDPGWNSAVSLLSRIYENLGKLQESERVMTAGIAASQRPKSLRVELAQLYVRQKQYDKAEGVLRTLIENDPEQLSYRISLASLFSRTEQPNKAEKVLREAIEAAPEDAQRYGLLVDFIARERSAEAAIRELEGFIQRNPDMSELRFGMVRLRLDNNEAGAAKRALEEIIAREGLEPNGLRARTILAQVLAAENEESPRIGILLDEVLKENPRDNDALLLMAKLDAKKGRYDEAIANFRSVLKDKPESSEVLQLLATAHLANGDRELARDTMSRAVQVNPGDNDLRLSLVKLLVQDGKADEALEQTNEVLKRDEYHETALAMKYELLGRKGDVAGMEEVAKLMQTGAPEKEEGYIREARLRLAQRDFDAALDIVDKLLDKNPESVPALLTKSDALVAQNKYGEAIEVADKLIEVQPGNPEGYYRKARLLQEQGDVDASFEFYELAIDKAPQSERVLTEFTEMGVSNGRAEQVKARLQGLIEDNPDHPLANSLIGLVNADEKDFAKAEEYFVRQTEITPDQAEPYSRLAQSRLAQGDAEGAVAAFNTGLEALPNNPQLLIGLAGLRERQEDFEVAISLYEKVLEQQPENAISINNLAALLSDHRTDAASLEKAAALAEKLEQTNQPAFLDTAGWVYYRKGDYDKAMEVLKRVVEEAPQVPVFHYHLGMTYFKKGDKAAAKEHLTRATQGDYQYQGIEEARKILESL